MLKKEIDMPNYEKIRITKNESYCGYMTTIYKAYPKDGKYEFDKAISFAIWDDMSFYADTNDRDINEISFDFNIDDPLYFPLNRFLGSDNEFVIDDDDTSARLEKYIRFYRDGNIIRITIYNKTKSEGYERSRSKFRVFIKNIGPDPRSKIEKYDDKIRIIKFLRDCEERLFEEYHQMTMDEYLELLRQDKVKSYKLNK